MMKNSQDKHYFMRGFVLVRFCIGPSMYFSLHCPQFTILEGNLELYARDLLFLTVALEPQARMGLQGTGILT